MDVVGNIREIRLRQALARQGYHLVKGGAGEFQIVEAFSPRVVAGSRFAMDLDAVEEWAARLAEAEPSIKGAAAPDH
jgi:hypothetical protein